MKLIPAAVKRRHIAKGLTFGRTEFIRDVLFSRDGFNLPVHMVTKASASLPPEEQIPSTNKKHLAYHKRHPFVAGYLDYRKGEKMVQTYVHGLDRYLHNSRVFPVYSLSRTNTGRTASSDPNGQNVPKRGPLAKAYRKSLIAPPGWYIVGLDFSQIELRLVGSMANDPTMIAVYAEGGDIHRETGIAVAGITDEAYDAMPDEERELIRFRAKAVN